MSDYVQEVIEAEHAGTLHLVKRRWQQILAGEFNSGIPVNASSVAFANRLLVKAGEGMLFGVAVYSSNVAAQFIQLHDSQTAPANGAVPSAVWTVAATANLNVSWIFPGRWCDRGIWLVNSSTAPTLTAGSADCFFDAQYI